MKKILFTATLLISSTLLFSQTKFGLKAGVNFANVTFEEEGSDLEVSPSSLTSFHFGGFAEIGLSKSLYFQPGLSISGKGFKFEQSESEGGFSGSEKITSNFMYLEVPLTLLAKFNAGTGKIFVGAGPYLGYGISGKEKYELKIDGPGTEFDESESDSDDIKFGDKEEEYKPLDLGLNFSTGYELANGLFINAGYGLGLNNISNGEGSSVKHKVVSISLGFKF
jgi:hypothetical protein